jgi:hypothetical protein
MKLGELVEIFECDPEGMPLNPQWIETEPEPAQEPELVPAKK